MVRPIAIPGRGILFMCEVMIRHPQDRIEVGLTRGKEWQQRRSIVPHVSPKGINKPASKKYVFLQVIDPQGIKMVSPTGFEPVTH